MVRAYRDIQNYAECCKYVRKYTNYYSRANEYVRTSNLRRHSALIYRAYTLWAINNISSNFDQTR